MNGDEDRRAGRESAGAGPEGEELERALRGMLARRAADIRSGPAWHAPGNGAPRRSGVRRFEGNRPARRWLLPAAAAAVVVALVVTVIAVRGGSPADDATPGPASGTTAGSTSGTAGTGAASSEGLVPAPEPVTQQPIPDGKQAVDALGVEIFVPTSLTLDPPCPGKSVSRPANGLTYAIGCIPVQLPAVWITTATAPATWNDPPPSTCANSVRLEDEAGCLTLTDTSADPQENTDTQAVSATMIWPAHDVALVAQFPAGQRGQALAVVESAHWVPVDRHGCAATRSPVVPADAVSLPEGSVLPADATSTSACWYSGGRLVASATLPADGGADSDSSGSASRSDPAAVQRSLENPGPPGNAPGIGTAPSYSPSPDGPSCSTLGRTEGVVFQATRPDGSIAVSAAQFADCTGGQYWTDGTHAQPVDEALASAIRGLTGFLLVFGYHAAPLDPETSIGTPATANDLPATSGDATPAPTTPVADATDSPGAAVSGTASPGTASPGTASPGTSESPVTGSSVTGTATSAVAPGQPPIPDGMQAVDALGVEIFVPKDLPVDPWACATGPGVDRPVPHVPYGAKCAAALLPRAAGWAVLSKGSVPAANTAACTTFTVRLGDETACAVAGADQEGTTSYTVDWPRHDVAITAVDPDPQVAERILRSAHVVSVDRNGCAASRSPMAVTGSDAATPILPTGATSLSVCWYLDNRLGASALLDSAAASRVIDAVNAAPPRWPAPQDRPSLTDCSTVARHDGVLLEAHLPDGSTAQAIGTFAACNGQQTVSNGAGAVLATAGLVSTIAQAAGLGHALALDYPYAPS